MNLKCIFGAKLFTVLILAAAIMAQSCVATIISTSKQRVSINSSPSDATIYLNDELLKETPGKVRVKRKHGGEIMIEKEGYKPHNEILYPAKSNYLSIISMLCFIYPYFVDQATGAAYRLNKNEINVDLIKIPDNIDGSEPIICEEVNFKFKAGDKLGNFYVAGKRKEILYFGKSVDVDAVNLKKDVNSILDDLGFNVAGKKDKLFSSSGNASYFIKAEVLKTKYDIKASNKYAHLNRTSTVCEMEVKWSLVNRNKEVKFEQVTVGYSVKNEEGGASAFYDAFENSFYDFMNNKKVYETAKEVEKVINESDDFSVITIAKPVIKVEEGKEIKRATNSVVTIENGDSHGSGCVISEEGYIVTNYHVVDGMDKVMVKFKNGFTLEGNVVRFNEKHDLALVKVSGVGFSPMLISEDNEINVGSDVYAIGTPADKGLGQTVTKGIISGVRAMDDMQFIQTDVSINPGSSGGALITSKGVLTGIVNAKLVGASVEGIGFAIPSATIFEELKIQY